MYVQFNERLGWHHNSFYKIETFWCSGGGVVVLVVVVVMVVVRGGLAISLTDEEIEAGSLMDTVIITMIPSLILRSAFDILANCQ